MRPDHRTLPTGDRARNILSHLVAGLRALWTKRWISGKRHLPLILALLPALLIAPEVIREIPMSKDHATHLFKVWHFWTELVPSGRLAGWSPYWVFGFPSDELVPCGGELWVGLFRGLTLGLLPWDRTYAVAYAGLLLFACGASFAFTRRFFGVKAAVLAAWITFYDPGASLEGGWHWHATWGVWPVTLAASFAQFTLLGLDRVLEVRSGKLLLWTGLGFGAALLTHQLTVVVFALVTPLLFADHLLRRKRPELVAFGRAAAALGLGAGLCAFYMLPFLSRVGETMDLGALHVPLSEVSQRFARFQTFGGVWPPIHALAILGGVWALSRRLPGSVLFTTSAVLLVLLASDFLLRTLHLERALPTLIKLEVNRLLLAAKLFWFPLAAHAAVCLWRLGRTHSSRLPRARRIAQGAVGLACATALLAPGWREFYAKQIKKEISGAHEQTHWADLQRVAEWSSRLKQSTSEFYRIAYEMPHVDHLSTVMPVYDGTPMYKFGYTPTQIYNKLPMYSSPDLLEAANVKYVVSDKVLGWSSLKQEMTFGRLRVYSFNRYTPNPFTLRGPGTAKLLEFGNETLRIELRGTSRESRLRLHVGAYPRWQADIDGQIVPLAVATVKGAEDPFLMEAPARDGVFTLSYVDRPVDVLGASLSLLALPLFFGLWWAERKRGVLQALFARLEPHRLWVFGAIATLLLSVAVVLALRTRTRERLLPPDSLFHRDDVQMTLGDVPCTREAPLSFRCGADTIEADVVQDSLLGLHLCMKTRVDGGALLLRWAGPQASFIRGSYAVPRKGNGAIEASLDGKPFGRIATRSYRTRQQFLQFDTRSHKGQHATFELRLTGAPLHCFDFGTVDEGVSPISLRHESQEARAKSAPVGVPEAG